MDRQIDEQMDRQRDEQIFIDQEIYLLIYRQMNRQIYGQIDTDEQMGGQLDRYRHMIDREMYRQINKKIEIKVNENGVSLDRQLVSDRQLDW